MQIREHIPPPVSNVDSILYEHSDVAPSGLVCSFILTIAVYLFKYFANADLIMTYLFIYAVLFFMLVYLFIIYYIFCLISKCYLIRFQNGNQEKGISSALLNKGNILQYQQ